MLLIIVHDFGVIFCGVHIFLVYSFSISSPLVGKKGLSHLLVCHFYTCKMLIVHYMYFWFSSSGCLALAVSSDYGVL